MNNGKKTVSLVGKRFFGQKKHFHWTIIILFTVFLVFNILILFQFNKNYWNDFLVLGELNQNGMQHYIHQNIKSKPTSIKVKGLYITAYSANSKNKVNEMLDLISKTELNSIVIDIKDYSGYILYDSKIPLVDELDLEKVLIKDVEGLIEKLKKNGIYVIARVSSFQDPILAEKKPEWALKSKNGGLWRDHKGLAWVDANKPEVWQHIINVAREAGRMGFDEINFDYIRFPTDGNLSDILYTNGDKKRYEVMSDFYSFLSEELAREPFYTSADLFGLTTERTGENDMAIGQRMMDAVKYFDYVCPMVYPSHYPKGYLGYDNPADHPYEVVYNAMKIGVDRIGGERARLRTWIQNFHLGAIYDADKIRAQIKASDDAGADGWILWNARNVYDGRGLEYVKGIYE